MCRGIPALVATTLFTGSAHAIASNEQPASPSGALTIRYENALMSAEIENVPLGTIFDRLSQSIALEARIVDPVITHWRVSAKLDTAPPQQGLKQILQGFSYAIYASDGRLVVYVLSTRPQEMAGSAEEQGPEPTARRHGNRPRVPASLDEFDPLSTPEATPKVSSEYGDTAGAADGASEEQAGDEARLQRALSALTSEFTHLYGEALGELADIADGRAIDALARAVTASTNLAPADRLQAVTALSRHALNAGLDDPVSADALTQLAGDPDDNVRAIAQQTLEDLRTRAQPLPYNGSQWVAE